METYIKVYRRMLGWGWYKDANTFRVFMHILLKANYSPSEYFGHEIKAGECVFGRKAWAKELGMSEQSIRTAINHLKSTTEITTRATNKFTIITVVKWEFWQMGVCESTTKSTTELTNEQPTTNQQLTTSKEYKNIRNKENKKIGRFIKPTIEEIQSYIKEKELNVDAERFFDYYESNGWMVSKNHMKDWKATLRGWNRREDDRRTEKDSRREWNRTDNNSWEARSNNRRNRDGDSYSKDIQEYAEAIAKNAANPIDYANL